jgi:hypothetical protein
MRPTARGRASILTHRLTERRSAPGAVIHHHTELPAEPPSVPGRCRRALGRSWPGRRSPSHDWWRWRVGDRLAATAFAARVSTPCNGPGHEGGGQSAGTPATTPVSPPRLLTRFVSPAMDENTIDPRSIAQVATLAADSPVLQLQPSSDDVHGPRPHSLRQHLSKACGHTNGSGMGGRHGLPRYPGRHA